MSSLRIRGASTLSEAPRFTILRRLRGFHHSSRELVFWGGAYIPGKQEGEVGHAVCFDLFGSPAYVRLTENVVAMPTSENLRQRYHDWYWATTLVEPVHWMRVRKEETHSLRLRLQAIKARKTAGLIRVARKRSA